MDQMQALVLASLEMVKYSDPETCRALGSPYTSQGWKVKLSNGKRQMGCIAFQFGPDGKPVLRELRLSKHLIRMNDEAEVLDTIRHEIAHILTDRSAHDYEELLRRKRRGGALVHGPEWKRMARLLGANPEATSRTATMPEPAYRLVCGCCGAVLLRRHKRSRSYLRKSHGPCGRAGIGQLRWERNPQV
jgi:predicted SprT family Zn-dependent metalloprotease